MCHSIITPVTITSTVDYTLGPLRGLSRQMVKKKIQYSLSINKKRSKNIPKSCLLTKKSFKSWKKNATTCSTPPREKKVLLWPAPIRNYHRRTHHVTSQGRQDRRKHLRWGSSTFTKRGDYCASPTTNGTWGYCWEKRFTKSKTGIALQLLHNRDENWEVKA